MIMINQRSKSKNFSFNSDYTAIAVALTEEDYNRINKEILLYDQLKGSPVKNKEKLDTLYKYFKLEFGFEMEDIITYGITDTIKAKTLEKIISVKLITDHTDCLSRKEQKYKSTQKTVYYCFANNDRYHNNNIVMHEDIRSSWNCLLAILDNPAYLLIYKIKK